MNAAEAPDTEDLPARQAPIRSFIGRIFLHGFCLLIAAGAFIAHQHFSLHGQTTPSLVALLAAGGFALVPVRALIGELFELEGKALHLVHGVGGLAFAGLSLGGVISGAPLLNHAALAPFAIMGAAQAVMHQDHPRNARQAAAMRRFATSLPQVERVHERARSHVARERGASRHGSHRHHFQSAGARRDRTTSGPWISERPQAGYRALRTHARVGRSRSGHRQTRRESGGGTCDPGFARAPRGGAAHLARELDGLAPVASKNAFAITAPVAVIAGSPPRLRATSRR